MKKLLLLVTAFALSLGSACAQNAKLQTLMPTQKVLQFKDNATSPRKAPGRKVELAEGQQVFGAYTSDNIASDGLGLPNYPGNYRVATQIPSEIIDIYDGCQIVKMRFGLCVDNQVSRVFIYPIDAEGNVGEAIVDQATKGGKKGWNEVVVDQPVTISKENVIGYLMGYDYVQSNKNDGQYYDNECFPLSLVNEGAYTCSTYVYGNLGQGTSWYNIGAEEYGNLSVQAVVEGEFPQYAVMPLDFPDVTVALGAEATADVTLLNQGTGGIQSIAYTVATNNAEADYENEITLSTPVTGFNSMTTVALPIPTDAVTGQTVKTITITKVNGEDNAAGANSCKGSLTTVSKIVDRTAAVEEFTGTQCGWCPRGLVGMERLRETFGDQFVGLGIHQYNSSDAMYLSPSTYASLPFTTAPSCMVNRTGSPIDPYYGSGDDICDDVQKALGVPAKAAVEVSATWNEDKTAVDAVANVETVVDNATYTVEFALVADQLSGTGSAWNQSNYYYQYTAAQVGNDPNLTPFCSGGAYGKSSITGYKFNDVVIAGCYKANKNPLPALTDMVLEQPQSVECTLNMPTKTTLKNAIDPEQVFAVAMVIDSEGHIANAAKIKVVEPEGTTGISSQPLNTSETVSYNLNGVQLAAPQQGVNIVRMANGQVRKVVVK